MARGDEILEVLPVAIYRTDTEGRITFYNQAAADLWGCRPGAGARWCGSSRIYKRDGSPMAPDECPMAQTMKERRPVRGVEVLLERPDGERIPCMPYPTPLFDDAGELTGGVNLLVDLRERRQTDSDNARLAAIVSSSDDAIISKTLAGVITTWNAGAEHIFGYTADEMIGQHISKLIPEELRDEETHIIAQISRGERVDHYETVRVAKDGRRIDLSLTVSPLRDASGRVTGASKVARDISERKRAEEVRRLLTDELNHRIKNTLATVQAIAGQTLRRAATPADFVTSFNGRIQALARAHGLLTGGSFQGAEIMQLVRDQLLIGSGDDHRISCGGPSLVLGAQPALHLALVLHELGTNARKHGALSAPSGQVMIKWEMRTSNGGRNLQLIWQESCGPPVTAPSARGFGSMLIEHSLQAHGGVVTMTYAEGGLRCEIMLPLAEREAPLFSEMARATPRAMVQRKAGSTLSGKRVLVVEDEALISLVLVDYLTEAGCHVVGPAQTLDKAKAAISNESFDAALVDGNLAGHSVDTIAIGLTQKGVPFTFVTGYGREALPAGFQDALIVEKPFTQEQVIGALERLLHPETNVVTMRARKDPS